jgi:hypothetical protein
LLSGLQAKRIPKRTATERDLSDFTSEHLGPTLAEDIAPDALELFRAEETTTRSPRERVPACGSAVVTFKSRSGESDRPRTNASQDDHEPTIPLDQRSEYVEDRDLRALRHPDPTAGTLSAVVAFFVSVALFGLAMSHRPPEDWNRLTANAGTVTHILAFPAFDPPRDISQTRTSRSQSAMATSVGSREALARSGVAMTARSSSTDRKTARRGQLQLRRLIREAPTASAGARSSSPVGHDASIDINTPAKAAELPVFHAPETEPSLRSPGAIVSPIAAPPTASTEIDRSVTAAATSPTPVALPVPTLPVRNNDATGIQAVLTRYQNAYTRLSAADAKMVWPSVNEQLLRRLFDQLEQQEVVLSDCQIEVNGAQAQASCGGKASYVPKVGRKSARVVSRHWTFQLRKVDDQWAIETIESRDSP